LSQSYYYTLASLPALKLEDSIPFDRNYFLQLCENTISPGDYQKIQKTSIEIPEDQDLLSGLSTQYWKWEKALRNALVKVRAKEMNLDGNSFLREEEILSDVEEIATAAIRQDTPLDAELFLSARRWDFIESLRTIQYFSIENLQVWYLQYQILERINQFDKEEGFRRYTEIYEDILKEQESSLLENEVKQ